MSLSTLTFFFILFIYIASLVSIFIKKKFDGLFKKVFRVINWIALCLTLIFILLWSFDIHLSNLKLEIIPFWTFLISAIILFGLTKLDKSEKTIYGVFFYGHLFLTVILIIPFIGIGISSMIYAPFWTDSILYEDNKVIIADEASGFLSMKPSPTVYIKNGLFSHQYKTDADPVYSIDSASLSSDIEKFSLIIYNDTIKRQIDIIK